VPLRQSLAFDFWGFSEYLKNLLTSHTWGLSDSSYPQTVQHFIFAALPHTLSKFLLIFFASMVTLGLFMFFKSIEREMNKDFSELSAFLRMDSGRVKKQAMLAALPGQAIFWSIISPLIFFALLFFETKFETYGLGTLIETALSAKDLPLLYGCLFCAALFGLATNAFFLFFKIILPGK
jgi:ABC-type dipeptide/oligopeptide/nickel transport system permease component